MKKGIKIVLILATVFLLLGVALCIISFSMGADPVEFVRDGTYTISINNPIKHVLDPDVYEPDREGSFGQRPGTFGEAVAEGENSYSVSDDIKNLDIEWVSGNVKIVRGEGEHITFAESDPDGIDADDKLYYTIEGDTLKIECCNSDTISIGINIDGGCGNKKLVVNVPYALEDVYIDTTSADVDMDGLEILDKLYISTTSGRVFIANMGAGNVELDSTSGSLQFEGSCREFVADSVSGLVIFTGSCRDIEADTSSGQVRFVLDTIPEEISADTVSGDVSMYLPPEASFELEYDTVSGDLECDFPVKMRGDGYVVGNGGAEIDVDTTSGSLSLMIYGERMP